MHIKVISIGTKMPSWVNTAFKEYSKRLSSYCKFDLIEIPNKTNKNIEQNKSEEAKLILDKINKVSLKDYIIALDLSGKAYATEELANYFNNLRTNLGIFNLTILIGGSDGLAKSCLEKADFKLSLSKLTFPHSLIRVILAEQIYRVFSYLANHPYHK